MSSLHDEPLPEPVLLLAASQPATVADVQIEAHPTPQIVPELALSTADEGAETDSISCADALALLTTGLGEIAVTSASTSTLTTPPPTAPTQASYHGCATEESDNSCETPTRITSAVHDSARRTRRTNGVVLARVEQSLDFLHALFTHCNQDTPHPDRHLPH